MLVANQTPSFVTKEISNECESIGIEYLPSKEMGTGMMSHKIAFLAREKEKSLIEEFSSIRYQPSNIELYNRYHPSRQCLYCSQIAYHTFLFDLPWMEVLPHT